MRNQEFLLFPPEELAKVLSNDDLNVPSEELVFHALIMWAKHDLANRQIFLARLLCHIRLPLLSPQVKITIVNNYIQIITCYCWQYLHI